MESPPSCSSYRPADLVSPRHAVSSDLRPPRCARRAPSPPDLLSPPVLPQGLLTAPCSRAGSGSKTLRPGFGRARGECLREGPLPVDLGEVPRVSFCSGEHVLGWSYSCTCLGGWRGGRGLRASSVSPSAHLFPQTWAAGNEWGASKGRSVGEAGIESAFQAPLPGPRAL